MRKYSPNPKREGTVVKGPKSAADMDLSPAEAERLLNDSKNCFQVKGKRQFVGVKDGKIYAFQDDNADGYHGYIISGKECCAKYSSVVDEVAALLDVDVKRLSRM